MACNSPRSAEPVTAFLICYGLALVYAVVRYGVFAPQNLENLPAFILNKGISMAAAFCFVLAFREQCRRERDQRCGLEPASWFRAGLFGVWAHVPLSLALLQPAYFREFYAGERLSFNGETIFLFGALAVGSIYLLSRPGLTPRRRWWGSLATLLLVATHVSFMGLARGLNINRSHAWLPPMWLLSLVGLALGIAYLLRTRPGLPAPAAQTDVQSAPPP
jgi:hypothetical protein